MQQSRSAAVLGDGPLVAALQERFADTRDIESFLVAQGIASEFWSRFGR